MASPTRPKLSHLTLATLAVSIASLAACSEASPNDAGGFEPGTTGDLRGGGALDTDPARVIGTTRGEQDECGAMVPQSVRGSGFDAHEGVAVRGRNPALSLGCEGDRDSDVIEHGVFELWLLAPERAGSPPHDTREPSAAIVYLDLNDNATHELSEPDWESNDGTFSGEAELKPNDFARQIPLLVHGQGFEAHEGSLAHVAKCPSRVIEDTGAAACRFVDGGAVFEGRFRSLSSLNVETPTAILYVWLGSLGLGPERGDPYFGATLTGPPCKIDGHLADCSFASEHFSVF